LVAALLGHLLGVGIAVANSGFQHGGDAGTAGRQGRRLRIECKKYSDTTTLSDRELIGEIDQALARDPGLEAWILAATRDVPEQLEDTLFRKALEAGVPVIIIDWKSQGFPCLAALCSIAPNVARRLISEDAADVSDNLQARAADAVEQLRSDLNTWTLGFERLRALSQVQLGKIWTSPRSSTAALNQNAAGGATAKNIDRPKLTAGLDEWWAVEARTDSPAAVIGSDGVGKTGGVLGWLVSRVNEQPIVPAIPSSSASELRSVSEVSIKRFLAGRLYELSGGVRSVEHWKQRLERLLRRPQDEGAVLTLFFDGINQEPSAPWIALLQNLQADPFAGRIRAIVTTRVFHFNDKLGQLHGLVVQPNVLLVNGYDLTPGGEFDKRLELEGLSRTDLHPDLIELAQTPRLFDLVVRLRDRLVQPIEVTIHRLLWEYGRDILGHRAGQSFSEEDWRAWLKEVASKHRDGVREFSLKTLGETASHAGLSNSEVYARLSDIIDGHFTIPGIGGTYRLKPEVVAHALGAGLLFGLEQGEEEDFDAIEAKLNQWLDPISGLQERAEVLRAAVSILVAQGQSSQGPLGSVLVTAWLQTQNLADTHLQELRGLSNHLQSALLDAIEHSPGYGQLSARMRAADALRAIPAGPDKAFDLIVSRPRRWLSVVSRHLVPPYARSADYERHRVSRLMHRIGVDVSGPRLVLGIDLEFVDWTDAAVAEIVPSLLEG